jgi:hypothetical protein
LGRVGQAGVLYEIFSFLYVKGRGDGTKVDGATVSPYFAADATRAELIWNRRVAVDCEFDGAALAGAFEFPAVC